MKFKNRRFITKGVGERLPLRLQLFLWSCIDSLPPMRDYLQVFKFTADSQGLKIIHTQEEPNYRQEYLLPEDAPVFLGKIFVIDDGEHSTMMLAEEY